MINKQREYKLNLKIQNFKMNEIILKKGDYSDQIFLIRKGEIALFKNEEIPFAIYKSGDIIGAADFIMEKPSRYSVKAISDAKIAIINPRFFGQIYDNDQLNIIRPVLQNLAEKIRTYEQMLDNLGKLDDEFSQEVGRSKSRIKFRAISKRAKRMLNNSQIVIDKFPFRVGRYTVRRVDMLFHKNDLRLLDNPPYKISRSHFSITKKDENYYFVDRGSNLGSIVNGKQIGGFESKSKIKLKQGVNKILFGSKRDKIEFEILV
ncbi:MAG: cyclic nucleotide-binding domain-containing protein [Candidatus Cloacimonadota bacterium]|nr:cyclic nucleotide-binding domain-containing protein [Candidatus Cloacimonadota bacterium]